MSIMFFHAADFLQLRQKLLGICLGGGTIHIIFRHNGRNQLLHGVVFLKGFENKAAQLVHGNQAIDLGAVSTAEDGGESVIASYDKCAFIGTDYEMAGHMQGQMIGDYLVANFDKLDLNGDGKISYVMFKGDEANAEAIARTQYGVEDADKVLTDAGKPALEFYDSANANKYLVDQNGTWSSQAATEYMQTILSQYSEANNNMVELVIANNDDMALGAISALQNAGYNKEGATYIPVFGVDATDAAKEKISDGSMTGTIKQDADGMATTIATVAQNFQGGKDKFDTVDTANVVGTWRVNIPYATYTGE